MNITPGCGKNYDIPAVTAWYLTKIENQLGDVVYLEYKPNTYSYKSSLSQVMTKALGSAVCDGSPVACPANPNQVCVMQLTIVGKTLGRIYSPNHGEIEFISSKTRLDVDDNRLDTIVIKDNVGKTLKRIAFTYISSNSGSKFTNNLTTQELKYRMFLQSLDEYDGLDSQIRSHHFSYNNIDALPPRLSFAQDHWGFFNGVDNDDLVPTYLAGKDVNGRILFPDVDGNREPDSAFSAIGMLNKVTYPTGGYSELTYESNNYWGTTLIYPPKTPVDWGITGSLDRTAVSEQMTIANPVQQDVLITAAATQNPYSQYPIDEIHNFATLKIYDETQAVYVLNERMGVGEQFRDYVQLLPDHSYRVTLTAIGEIVSASTYFEYYATAPSEVTTNVPTGGMRIKKIVSKDVIQTTAEQVNYLYAKLSDLSKSSGKTGHPPQYYRISTSRSPCGGACGFYECRYGSLYSNSQTSLYPVNGSNVYYQHVVVYKGTESNYTNGAEEHEFIIRFDEPGYIVTGEHIRNAPYTNFGWGNGLEQAVRVYVYDDDSLKLSKETTNNYVLDNRYNNSVGSLTVRNRYNPICTSDVVVDCDTSNINRRSVEYNCTASHSHSWLIGGWPLFGNGRAECIAPGANNEIVVVWTHPCYGRSSGESVIVQSAIEHLDAIEYKTIAYWFYNASVTEKLYDGDGANPVTTVSEFFYDNSEHGFLTRTSVIGSNKTARQTTQWFPQDYGDVGNIEILKSKNILNKPIKIEETIGGNQVGGTIVEYGDNGLPKNIHKYRTTELVPSINHDPQTMVPSENYELVGSLMYSTSNNLKEVQSTTAPTIAYVYDYFDSKPVAKVLNASASQVAYTSFESDGKGNWDFSGATYSDIRCKTGDRYYKLAGGNISRTLNAGSYSLEFWAKGTITVSTQATLVDKSEPDVNGWSLHRYNVYSSGTTTLLLSGNADSYMDELRLFPTGSQMHTYTYKLGVGISSETDANNLTSYYEYDEFGRLKYVKDDNENVLRTYEYRYTTSE